MQETISLKFGEEELQLRFYKFKYKPDYKEFEEPIKGEAKTIAEFAVVYFETQVDSLEEEDLRKEISFVGERGHDEPQELILAEDLILKESYEEP
jgi:hypothetical protein